MTSSVLALILNWRSADLTLRAAETCLAAMEDVAGEVTVIDNDSGDGSFEQIAAEIAARGWDRVRLLQSGRNGGFGAGNNFGIRAGLQGGALPDYIYILNSDAFPDPGAIRALRDHLDRHPEAGFAGSATRGPDGTPHLTTFRFPSIASEFETAARTGPISRLLSQRAVPRPAPAQSGPVDWVAGASLMLRRSVLDRVGLFDEGYFLYFEETDLCLRLTRMGQTVHFVAESGVVHIGSASTGMKGWQRVPDYWFASRWRYFCKNHGRAYAAAATLAHLAGGAIHRLRTGEGREDPPRFLRTLLRHDARALLRALPPEPE